MVKLAKAGKKSRGSIFSKEKDKKISFSFDSASAGSVMVAGDFNNWQPLKSPLKKEKNNKWKKEISLKPGRYEYKFVVDGNWITDPSNQNKVWNSHGTENSVIEVR